MSHQNWKALWQTIYDDNNSITWGLEEAHENEKRYEKRVKKHKLGVDPVVTKKLAKRKLKKELTVLHSQKRHQLEVKHQFKKNPDVAESFIEDSQMDKYERARKQFPIGQVSYSGPVSPLVMSPMSPYNKTFYGGMSMEDRYQLVPPGRKIATKKKDLKKKTN